MFELSSSNDARFGADTRMETYADGDRKFVAHINATRFWRVRAVESRTNEPLSHWSLAIRITQYDSAYDRIKATGKVRIYVSNAEIQGTFKWVDAKKLRGFDIELSKLIVDELSRRIGRPLEEVQPVSVLWTELLETPRKGLADFIISSITKLETRKRDFGIEFSEPYYCTTHALIYRAGAPDRTIREMIAGKNVGVQDKTTNARLAEELAKETAFHLKTFDTTETLINALMRSEIDYGIADIPFAVSAQIGRRSGGQDRLGFKTFRDEDFPASVPEAERVEEYAIAVRGGEHQLLSVIDGVIGKAKQDGTLARLFKEATQEFEDDPGRYRRKPRRRHGARTPVAVLLIVCEIHFPACDLAETFVASGQEGPLQSFNSRQVVGV